jgi:chromosome segregation ATPase
MARSRKPQGIGKANPIRLDAMLCYLYLLPLQFPEVNAVFSALVHFMLCQERLHDLQATIAAFSARVESLQERFSDQQAKITMFTALIRSLQGRFHGQQATIAMSSVLIKSLQERLYYQQVMMASLTARLQRAGTPRDDDRQEAPVEHDLTLYASLYAP